MPCTKCKSDFTLFNWKIRCGECEDKYCNKCLKRKDGVLYCDVCLVLIKRPPDRVKLMELKSKDLRDYLNKNNVSTYGVVEKKEMVDLLCNKCIPERQRKGVDKLTANFGDPLRPLNGLISNLESVISDTRSTSSNAPVHAQNVPSYSGEPSAPPYEDPGEQPTTSHIPPNIEFTPESSPLGQRRPKLEDFNNVEELKELSSKQLKILLTFNRVEFKGCIEKGRYFSGILDEGV